MSVVITSFNHREYLIEALESVIAQTVRPREILIADDGSTDGSVATIQSYADRFPDWVIPVLHDNLGIPRNRNSALQRARGAYVGVLDGDDLFTPNKLERQREALALAPEAGVVYANFCRVTEARGVVGKRYATPQPQGDILLQVADLNFGIMRTMLARTDAVRAAGFMDPLLPKFDGLWLTIQLAAAHRFTYVNEILVEKRMHPTSDSKKNMAQDVRDLSLIFERVRALTGHLPAEDRQHLHKRWTAHIAKLGR